MSQFDEFLKEVEGLTEKEIKVLVVTANRAAVRARSCVKQPKQRGWDYIDTPSAYYGRFPEASSQ